MENEMMKVEIISKQTIKPSSPTPSHQRTHKLNFFDQVAPPIPSPFLIFYSPTPNISRSTKSDILKTSLSKTLTHFYPLAGRLKDSYTIDCNDQGASYIEARVNSPMSTVLKKPEFDCLVQLLPFHPYENTPKSPPFVAVQVNHFACGGIAICANIMHVVVDAAASASFFKSWAAIAKGIINNVDAGGLEGVVYDCASLFPPLDVSSLSRSTVDDAMVDGVVLKRLVFYGSKIGALRDEINGMGVYRPTRVEAVSSLIWSAIIAMAADEEDQTSTSNIINPSPSPSMHIAVNAVNLRSRINPPFPQCMGNMCHVTIARSLVSKTTSLSCLAQKIHDSVSNIDDTYVKEYFGSGTHLNSYKHMLAELGNCSKLGRLFGFSGCCRFPFYETDFGWGKPTWFAIPMRANMSALLMDSSDGEGIEAWIGLTKQEMTKFEQHPAILAYATLNPSINVLPTLPSKL